MGSARNKVLNAYANKALAILRIRAVGSSIVLSTETDFLKPISIINPSHVIPCSDIYPDINTEADLIFLKPAKGQPRVTIRANLIQNGTKV